jgi:hypothetical protein
MGSLLPKALPLDGPQAKNLLDRGRLASNHAPPAVAAGSFLVEVLRLFPIRRRRFSRAAAPLPPTSW